MEGQREWYPQFPPRAEAAEADHPNIYPRFRNIVN